MADASAAKSGSGSGDATHSQQIPTSGKLLRRSNSDRLRMHAPSSIQVKAPSANPAAEWKLNAIPLLSPLDLESASWIGGPAPTGPRANGQKGADERSEAAVASTVVGMEEGAEWATWRHPAAPFYYEPVPSNAPPFLLPHYN